MIRLPGSKSQGQSTTALVEAVDLFPTFVDVATGGVVPGYLDGVSLKPLLIDPTTSVKDAAFSEFVKCYSCCPNTFPGPNNNSCARFRCAPAVPDPTIQEMETCFDVPREQIDFIGYTMRTQGNLDTVWTTSRTHWTALHRRTRAVWHALLRTHVRGMPIASISACDTRWCDQFTFCRRSYRYTEWLHFDGAILHGDFGRKVATELYDHRQDDGTDPDISENANLAATADSGLLNTLHAALVAGFPVPK